MLKVERAAAPTGLRFERFVSQRYKRLDPPSEQSGEERAVSVTEIRGEFRRSTPEPVQEHEGRLALG